VVPQKIQITVTLPTGDTYKNVARCNTYPDLKSRLVLCFAQFIQQSYAVQDVGRRRYGIPGRRTGGGQKTEYDPDGLAHDLIYESARIQHGLYYRPGVSIERLENDLALISLGISGEAFQIGKDAGLRYIYIGNMPGAKAESTFCYKCGREVIERVGYTIGDNVISDGACPDCGAKIAGFNL
jgi:hypothetical protein